MNRYKVQAIDSALRAALVERGESISWLIVANDLPSAWRKFVHQRFGVLKPDPACYDISFHASGAA